MEINHIIIDSANDIGDIKSQMLDFIESFDGDFSGQNGEDYTSDEAIEKGYESDVEYYFDLEVGKGKSLYDVLKYVMLELDSTYHNGEYSGSDFDVVDLKDGRYMVMFAYASAD